MTVLVAQNFAATCEATESGDYICHCREGYTGDKCDRCVGGVRLCGLQRTIGDD